MGTGSTNLSSPKRTEKFELGTLSNRLNLRDVVSVASQ